MGLHGPRARLLAGAAFGLLVGIVSASPASAKNVAPYKPYLAAQAQQALNAAKFSNSRLTPKYANVRCYVSDEAFEKATESRMGDDAVDLWAYYEPGNHTVYMRPWICRGAVQFVLKVELNRTQFVSKYEVGAYTTLLHEAMHRQGINSERAAECLANDAVRWAALRLGANKSEANLLSRLAFDFSAEYVRASYRMVSGRCQSALAHADWTDFVGI